MNARYQEFSYAWRVVLASAMGIGLGLSPIPIYTLGVFATPLIEEFGWRIDQIMLALPVLTLCSLVLAPVFGLIADKIGVRKVAIGAIVAFSFALMLHALNPGSYGFYLFAWTIVAIAGIGTLPITWTRAINNWFHDCKGLALGIALVATGLFGALIKIYVATLIDWVGWRGAFIGLGLVPLVVSLPVALLLFRDVTDDKVPAEVKPVKAEAASGEISGLTAKQAFSDWRFWVMGISFIVISFGVGGTIPNLENLLTHKGFDLSKAILLASFVGYSVMVGRLVGGFLIDHIWAPAVAFCLLVLPALSCFILMQADLTFGITLFAICLIGLAAGAEQDLMAFLVAKYFGMKAYGAVYGLLYGLFALGAGMGPYIFGRSFAASGSYDAMLKLSIFAFLFGAAMLLALGRYRQFENANSTEKT